MRKTGRILAVVLGVTTLALAVWAAGKAATVRIVAEDLVLVVTFEDRSTLRVTTKGTPLKAGEYWVKNYSFFKKDDKKGLWEIRCLHNVGSMKTIMVTEGQDKVIDPGPPLRLRLYVRQGKGEKSDTVGISFSMIGKYSEIYQPYAFKGKRKPRPPVVMVKNLEGKVLHKAAMNVDANGACRNEWKFGAFKGKFTLDWEFDLGPFEYLYNEKTQYDVE